MSVETVKQARVENLRAMAKALGSTSELSRLIGPGADAYLRSMTSPGAKRSCGPQFAARVEKALALPADWLSMPHDADAIGDAIADARRARAAQPAQLDLIPRDPIADFLGGPVAQLIAPAAFPPEIAAGDLVFFDASDNAARRPGLYVINAAGVQTIGRLSVGFSGAVFTLGTESAPADTVQTAGRVVGILRKIP